MYEGQEREERREWGSEGATGDVQNLAQSPGHRLQRGGMQRRMSAALQSKPCCTLCMSLRCGQCPTKAQSAL